MKRKTLTCPWWFIHSFDNPLRKRFQPAAEILRGLVQPGDTVLDVGCGMGYFTLPLARMVGETGNVIAADLQPQMLAGLRRRAEQAGLMDRIRLLQTTPENIGLETRLDFALAFWMVHEVRDPLALLKEIYTQLRPGGCLLMVEPVGHVRAAQFEREVHLARSLSFRAEPGPKVRLSRSILLTK